MEQSSCKNCFFYRAWSCHRSPPVRLPRKFAEEATSGNRVRDENVSWDWPTVSPDDWCGEWKDKV